MAIFTELSLGFKSVCGQNVYEGGGREKPICMQIQGFDVKRMYGRGDGYLFSSNEGIGFSILESFSYASFFSFSLVVPTRFYVQSKCVYALNYGPFLERKRCEAGLVFAKIVLLLFILL